MSSQTGSLTPLDYQSLYEGELLEQVLPFWEAHSVDSEHGGFYTCLDELGGVFDTDKFVWLQGREIWCFAYMYNSINESKKRAAWLDIAKTGAEFLLEKCRDEQGRFYFAVDKAGNP